MHWKVKCANNLFYRHHYYCSIIIIVISSDYSEALKITKSVFVASSLRNFADRTWRVSFFFLLLLRWSKQVMFEYGRCRIHTLELLLCSGMQLCFGSWCRACVGHLIIIMFERQPHQHGQSESQLSLRIVHKPPHLHNLLIPNGKSSIALKRKIIAR